MENTIKLGNNVRDIVTGFEGIATSKVEYLNGCVQYGVQPPVDKEGKRPDPIFIDWQQLTVLEQGGIEFEGKKTGGPAANIPKRYSN